MRFIHLLTLLASITAASCGQGPREQIVLHTDSLTSSRSDFVAYLPTQNLVVFKNQLGNKIDLYDAKQGQWVTSVYPFWHHNFSANLQSLTWLAPDTMLVLFKHLPSLYYFDRYGHCYLKRDFGEGELCHFSTSHNQPVVHRGRLLIPLLPGIESTSLPAQVSEARELVVDLNTGKAVDTIKVPAPAQTALTGLRHQLATRTQVGDTLVYVWGYGGQFALLHLPTGQITYRPLPGQSTELLPFGGSYANNRVQQAYYYQNPVYDHISYDPYRHRYYLFRFEPMEKMGPKHERPFTIYVLTEDFMLTSSHLMPAGKYVPDHELITPAGLLLMRNQTERPNELIFEKIDLE